jgi:tRNA nucleotidyltransferase (CCA-adding enzyme)
MKILDEVLKEIKPPKEEEQEIRSKIDEVLGKINSNIKDARAVLGGSGAKGTWIRGIHDADLFVLFDYEKYRESSKISDILEKTLNKAFKNVARLHGSRDYFQIKKGRFTFEMIPILKIKKAEDAKNITDISPLHAKWVNKYKELREEILLTKQFCKANGCYGAESYIKGFSGYICEILTIYYGSFTNLAKNATKWKDKVIVDVEGYYKKRNVLFELNRSKTYSPLIIIDPVQKDRNAAAALSKEKFDIFKLKCKEFLKKPSKKLFEKKTIDVGKLGKKAKNKKLVLLDAAAKQGKEDVVGAKLLKALEHIKKELIFNGFTVLDYNWEWSKGKKALFYFILDKKALSKIKVQTGPPLKAKSNVVLFRKKHKNVFVKNGRTYAKVNRKFTKAEELIGWLVKSDYIKSKVKSIRIR